jgi:hypothetical protein
MPPEVTMTKTSTDSLSSSPTDSQRDALARLQRIYGRSGVAPNLFGRRPALPSEIQRLAAARQQPAARSPEPRQPIKNKKRG